MDKIQRFLSEFQEIAKVNGVRIERRLENVSMMNMLDLTETMVIEEFLRHSTVDDFLEGPIQKTGHSDAWAFGQNIKGYEVYIKLSIVEKGKRKRAVCISFHQSTRPLILRA